MKLPRLNPDENPNRATPEHIYRDMLGRPLAKSLPTNPSIIPSPDGALTARRQVPGDLPPPEAIPPNEPNSI